MKQQRIYFVLFAVVCGLASVMSLCIGVGLLSQSPQSDVPLKADPQVIDFGVVKEKQVSGSAILTNTSTEPIRILHVFVSCSCSSVNMKQDEVKPNERVPPLTAAMTLADSGQTQSVITIVYADAKQEQHSLLLRLKGEKID